MTTVAISKLERAMATDGQTTWENYKFQSAKKIKILQKDDDSRIFLAVAGNAEATERFEAWFSEYINTAKNKRVKFPRDLKCEAVVYYEDTDEIYLFHNSGIPIPVGGPFFAVGSGAPYALAVLEYGGTLKDALSISGKLDPHTGFGVQYESFGTNRKRRNQHHVE